MNRAELIGDGPNQLIPADSNTRGRPTGKRRKPSNKARVGNGVLF